MGVFSAYARRFRALASDPPPGVEGQVYWNTADDELRVYDGSSWAAVGGGGGGSGVIVAGVASAVAAEGLANATFGDASVIPAPHAFTVATLKVRTGGTQGDDSLFVRLVKNGSTAATLTIPTGSAAGTYSTSPAVAFAEGDLLTISCENAATDTSASISGISLSVS